MSFDHPAPTLRNGTSHDVIVIGAQPAGLATAMLLARHERRILLLGDSLVMSVWVRLCGIGGCVGRFVSPTSGVGLSHWVFRIEGGQVWWLLGEDRRVSTESLLEQG